MFISKVNIELVNLSLNVEIECGCDGYFAATLYLNNEKLQTTSYQKDKKISFELTRSGIYCVAAFVRLNEFKDRKTSNKLKIFLVDVDSKIDSLTYQKNKTSIDDYEEVISLLEEKYKTTADVSALFQLCRIEKKMWSTVTERMRSAAKTSFEKKPSQQSIYWYCESFCANMTPGFSLKFVENVFATLGDSELSALKLIYLASLNHKNGDFHKFEFYLRQFRSSGVFFNYYKEQELLWLDEPCVDVSPGRFNWAGGEVYFDSKVNIGRSGDAKYVFSVSCDVVYFKRYVNFFVNSWRLNCSSSSILHIVIINPDLEAVSIADGLGDNVHVSYFRTSHYNNLAPISATARFVYLERLLDYFKLPVVVCDFDIVINENIDFLIEDLVNRNVDQLARVIGAVHPWQRYTAGFNVFNFSKPAICAAKLMRDMAIKQFEFDIKRIYVDQSILEGAIRFSERRTGYDVEFADMSMLSQVFKIPTGSHQSKIDALSSSLKVIQEKI